MSFPSNFSVSNSSQDFQISSSLAQQDSDANQSPFFGPQQWKDYFGIDISKGPTYTVMDQNRTFVFPMPMLNGKPFTLATLGKLAQTDQNGSENVSMVNGQSSALPGAIRDAWKSTLENLSEEDDVIKDENC